MHSIAKFIQHPTWVVRRSATNQEAGFWSDDTVLYEFSISSRFVHANEIFWNILQRQRSLESKYESLLHYKSNIKSIQTTMYTTNIRAGIARAFRAHREVHSNAELVEKCTEIVNRNPRNLERLRIARKPSGYHLEKPGRSYWHK